MGTKTISIMDDAYELLVMHKGKDESFSDVIRKEFSKKKDIKSYAGVWSDLSDKDVLEIKENIKKYKKATTKSLKKR